jgi:hypothetical protein
LQFLFDKKHKDSLFEQAFLQLVTALHMGKVSAGDRLPSVRQMAVRNNINHKNAFSICSDTTSGSLVLIRTLLRADAVRANLVACFARDT